MKKDQRLGHRGLKGRLLGDTAMAQTTVQGDSEASGMSVETPSVSPWCPRLIDIYLPVKLFKERSGSRVYFFSYL